MGSRERIEDGRVHGNAMVATAERDVGAMVVGGLGLYNVGSGQEMVWLSMWLLILALP